MTEAPRIGRYRLVRPLGQGAGGAVYEAVTEPEGTAVALERLDPRALLADPRVVDRLRRDLAAAGAVEHPGIVRPLDVGEAGGAVYVVHELVAGARPITAAFGGRPLAERVGLVRQAAQALGAAHARGVVHRAVSPADVLVDAAGRVRVTGFGLALVPGRSTGGLAAPEARLEGLHAATPRTDVWALGALLFHALTGAWPDPAGGQGPADLDPRVPAGLDVICRRALAPRPEDRHPDGAALASALHAAATRTSTGRAAALGFAGAAPLDVGARLGRCVLVDRIGAGGMGQVFRGRDEAAGRDVAVKVLPAGASDERRQRFLREAQAAARVRHPHVVAVHDAGEVGGALYLVMDLVDGEPLDALLARGALEPRRAVELVLALAAAVEALHAHGVLHRDLKPGNVLVDAAGAPRLTDFGVAALEGAERLTRTHQGVGTPLYMAPEQLDGGDVDERADVYGLGAVLYEALTGAQPFSDSTSLVHLATLKADGPAPPSRRRRGLDPALDAVCLRALACAPDARYPSAKALGDDLARWRAGERVLATAPRRRPRLLVAAALALLVALAWTLLGPRATAPEAARLAEARRALEAEAHAARRLAELDTAAARALLASAPGADAEAARERAALAAWVGLAHLARGEAPEAAAAAAAVGSDATLPARLLRAGLAPGADPAATLAAVDEARRAGLDAPELQGWRLLALAAGGLAREDALALLRELPGARRRGALDEAALAHLEVEGLAAAGRRAEAEAALARLEPTPPALRWPVALLAAEDAATRDQPDAALAALEGLTPPPGPPRPRELVLARRVAEVVESAVADAARRQGSLGGPSTLPAWLSLHARVAPGAAPPDALRDGLLQLGGRAYASGKSHEAAALAVALCDVWPDDPAVHSLAIHCIGAASTGVKVDPERAAAVMLQAARVAGSAVDRAAARLVRLHVLLDARRPAEARAGLPEAEAAVDAAGADEEGQGCRGRLELLRARLLRAEGDVDGALAVLERAGDLPESTPGERLLQRFDLLVGGGREADALRLAEEYVRAPLTIGPVRKHVGEHVWALATRSRRFELLAPLLETMVVEQRLDGWGQWGLRLALVRVRQGDHPGAARALRETQARSLAPKTLADRLEAADPDALVDLARLLGEDPAVWISPAAPRRP